MIYLYLVTLLLYLIWIYLILHTYEYYGKCKKPYFKFRVFHVILLGIAFIIPAIGIVASVIILFNYTMTLFVDEHIVLECKLKDILNKEL